MQLNNPVLVALLSLSPHLISATPTVNQRVPIDEDHMKNILVTLKQDGVIFDWNSIQKRSFPDPRIPTDQMPSCGESNDPSQIIPKTTT
jgi:hypothetical protein